MTCINYGNAIVCMSDAFVDLKPYGAHVWVEMHYLGPTFYRSKNAIKVIETPSKKTWDAYRRWVNRPQNDQNHKSANHQHL